LTCLKDGVPVPAPEADKAVIINPPRRLREATRIYIKEL